MGDENIIKFIGDKNIKMIGVTAMTFMIPEAYRLAEIIKNTYPECKIICGGLHPSALPILTLEECKYIDVVVIGQGEEITLKLVQSIEKNKNFYEIEGIVFRDGGKIIRNRGRGLLKNIDKLPYPKRELLTKEEQKFKDVRIALSRGCFCSCSSCSIYPKIVQMRNVVNVVQEIEKTFIKYKPEIITLNHHFSEEDTNWFKNFYSKIGQYDFCKKTK
ncbi:MAG: cobalamin-dependent protein [bacterium]|nr:cobalamin-dependent protein [bacterium]